MKAGHYENRKESVDIMIRSSQEIIHDLIGYGVDFAHDGDKLLYTREGAHSRQDSFSRGYHRTGDYEQTSCTGEKASECNDL